MEATETLIRCGNCAQPIHMTMAGYVHTLLDTRFCHDGRPARVDTSGTAIQDLEVAHAQVCEQDDPHDCWDCPDFAPMDEAGDAVMEEARRLATMGPKNVARAERGAMAMRAFFGHAEGSLSELLTDLYAYAQREGITWETAQQIAAQRFTNETPKS